MAELAEVRLPALFLHSREADVVPYALGRTLFNAYEGPKSFLELLGDHNPCYLFTGQVYIDGLDRSLPGLPGAE